MTYEEAVKKQNEELIDMIDDEIAKDCNLYGVGSYALAEAFIKMGPKEFMVAVEKMAETLMVWQLDRRAQAEKFLFELRAAKKRLDILQGGNSPTGAA